jgi:thiol-disulfide isomerase/thioredoxin
VCHVKRLSEQIESAMARTSSTMLELGTKAPEFDLPDPATGRTVSLADVARAPALLVAFICNHCPFVVHIREAFAAFAEEYSENGLAVIAINANDAAGYPADAPEKMVEVARQYGYGFPYLYDASQETAKRYRAACTPDFFLFDGQRTLVYRGQFDDARPGNKEPVTGKDLRAAVDAVLAGHPVTTEQKPSLGCNIKWRPGNAPDYFG